jgi:outer membrane protein assembly factor BamB
LRAADGGVLWHSPSQTSWSFSLLSPFIGSVIYFDAFETLPPETLALFGTNKGQVYFYAVNATNGSLYWSVPVGPVINIYPHITL